MSISKGYRRESVVFQLKKALRNHWQMYLLFLLPLVHIIVFKYWPIYGIQIAFKKWNPLLGISGSKWVGFTHFEQFFNSPDALIYIWNTLRIAVMELVLGFTIPVFLAIAVNSCPSNRYKKTVQLVTYAPHFISTVIVVSILEQITDTRIGIVNVMIMKLGGKPIGFMGNPDWFPWLYTLSGIWHSAGYSSIVYIAALTGISPELHEAATVDGASKVQRIWHVDIPGILPTIILMLIVHVGNMLNVGYAKVYLMQNPMNLSTSEIISTYVYKVGLQNSNYSFSTAINLMNTIVSLVMVTSTNAISKRLSDTSLW